MKSALVILIFSMLSLPAFAVDTSGCTPLIEVTADTQTHSGALLSVHAYKPRSEQCWNSNQAAVEITYRWAEDGINANGTEVYFWLRVNDNVVQVKTSGSCRIASESGVEKNTGRPWYDCRASALVPVLNDRMGRYKVEVAPRKSGYWDTGGFEQNYIFSL